MFAGNKDQVSAINHKMYIYLRLCREILQTLCNSQSKEDLTTLWSQTTF
jgi:hypothetical protein